jgi:hypothetical protein
VQFHQALLDDFAEVTSFAGIDNDLAGRRHARQCSSSWQAYPTRSSIPVWRKLPHN